MERKKMKKKTIIINVFASVLILVVGFTPALESEKTNLPVIQTDLVTIEVNHYLGRQQKQIRTSVTATEAEEIKFYLTELYKAQERNDYPTISKYEALLNEKGIVGPQVQKIMSKNAARSLIGTRYHPISLTSTAGENISNRLCYFNAIGEGVVLWWLGLQVWEGITKLIKNASSFFEAFILFIVFLPLLLLTLVLSNLIPLRVLAPIGVLALRNGTISCVGLNGVQKVTAGVEPYEVNLSWFTGVTINFLPTTNHTAFLFVSGMAIKAEGINQ